MSCGLTYSVLGFIVFVFMLVLGAMAWSFTNESSPSGGTRDDLRGISVTATILSAVAIAVMLAVWKIYG